MSNCDRNTSTFEIPCSIFCGSLFLIRYSSVLKPDEHRQSHPDDCNRNDDPCQGRHRHPNRLAHDFVDLTHGGIPTSPDDRVDKALGLVTIFAIYGREKDFARRIENPVFRGSTNDRDDG